MAASDASKLFRVHPTAAAIGCASAGSGAAIFGSLLVIGYVVSDLNNLYYEIMAEMDSFKACF